MAMETILWQQYSLKADDLQPVSGGQVNQCWRSGPWLVKRYDLSRVPKEKALMSTRLQAAASAAGLPVPAVRPAADGSLWVTDDSGGLLTVMAFAPGARRQRGSLRTAEAAGAGRVLARLHGVLREVQPLDLVPPQPPAAGAFGAKWAELKAQALAVPERLPFDGLVAEAADQVLQMAQQVPEPDWTAQPWQLCHGDFHQDNLLFDEAGQVTAVLDFDNAAAGWPTAEACMAWNLICCADAAAPVMTEAGAAFLEGYRDASGLSAAAWRDAMGVYWYTLAANTWPAGLRYREPERFRPEWGAVFELRMQALRRLAVQAVG